MHSLALFARHSFRQIRSSQARFLALMGICALGSGFFAGLMMCGPDMRSDIDAYFRAQHVCDVRMISSMGFSTAEIDAIAHTDHVAQIMPSHTVDASIRFRDKQAAARISSIDPEICARASHDSGDGSAASGAESKAAQDGSSDAASVQDASRDYAYLNRLELISGRMPTQAGECVVAAQAPALPLSLGDELDIISTQDGLDTVFATTHLQVVGLVRSPMYPYTRSFGTTTLGSGAIEQYIYTPTSTFAEDFPYTELFLTQNENQRCPSMPPQYKEESTALKEQLEAKKDELADMRQASLKAHAQKKLDDKKAEFEDQKAQAEDKLTEAKDTLTRSHDELSTHEKSLREGKAKLEAGRARLAQAKADAEQEFARAEAQLDEGKTRILGAAAASGMHASSVEELLEEIAHAKEALAGAGAGAGAGAAGADAGAGASGAGNVRAGGAGAGAEKSTATSVSGSEATSAQAKAQAEAKLKALTELERKAQTLIHQARVLSQKQAEAASTFDRKAELLRTKEHELASAQKKLAQGRACYIEGQARFDEKAQETASTLDKAQAELDRAQAKIDALDIPDIYVLDRTQHEGAHLFDSDTKRMDTLARVFPLMFFLVAALVALTTMTRMVEEERGLIGIYKSLGYSNAQIMVKYLGYAFIASGVGACIGIAVLTQVLPTIIMKAYSVIYSIPVSTFPLPVSWDVCALAFGLGVGITLLATFITTWRSLAETPASLMLPRAPKAGKRILLERIHPLWHVLSFSWKISLRNLFLYKKRLFMTIMGIGGCTALLLVGFGLHDAIWAIIDKQYGEITHYELTVGMSDESLETDIVHAQDILSRHDEVTRMTRVHSQHMLALGPENDASIPKKTLVDLVVPEDAESFSQLVSLRNRITKEPLELSDDSVIVSEKFASLHHLAQGDSFILYKQDRVGNAHGGGIELTIGGICENYIGNKVYMTKDNYQRIAHDDPRFSTILAQVPTSADEAVQDALSRDLYSLPDVSMVSFSHDTLNTYRKMISVVDMVVAVLVISAVLLAFIVLYNLLNINIEERIREIASLKVLGFTRREVYSYVFRDSLLLCVMGDVLGIGLGVLLDQFVVQTAEVEYVMFARVIHAPSFVLAFLLTLVFVLCILAMMCPKLNKIDMVLSLKSID